MPAEGQELVVPPEARRHSRHLAPRPQFLLFNYHHYYYFYYYDYYYYDYYYYCY